MRPAAADHLLVKIIRLHDRIGIAILQILAEHIQAIARTEQVLPFRIDTGRVEIMRVAQIILFPQHAKAHIVRFGA